MLIRNQYLEAIRGFYESDLIKIITGIRRSGKSIILEQIMKEIRKKSENVIYLNFEDERIISTIPTCEKLLTYIDSKKKNKKKYYLFFDEIQEVKDWQLACKTLRLYNNSIFITGSNSKLLSKEFTTAFSGRYVSFQIRPFVYKEIEAYCKKLKKECSINDYLIWGGFPKRFEFTSKDQIKYLNEINNSIVEKDLIARYNIQNIELFKRITNYILRSNARIFSARSIEGYLKNEHVEGSINTIIKYLNYLEEAYIIDRIKPYSTKNKSELAYYFKVYNSDVSFNSIRSFDNRYDLTHNLENIIYNELLYMGYMINVFTNEEKEIDFLASKENKTYYIQVAYSIAEEKTYEREFKAFDNLDNKSKKIIITNDDFDYSTSMVTHIKLKDFLRLNSLEEI